MGTLHQRSADISLLHPRFRVALVALLARLHLEKLPFDVFEAARSPWRQADLYAQGRTVPGAKVTKAGPWDSFHQFGLGADLVLHPKAGWSWDNSTPETKAAWERMHELAVEEGLEFLSFEAPHVQFADIEIADLRAGRYPEGGDQAWRDNLVTWIDGWDLRPHAPAKPGAVDA